MTEQLTDAQKRVQVARDVIEQLNAETLVSQPGQYVEMRVQEVKAEITKDSQIKEVFDSLPTCKVCVLGACFVSMVRRYNDITINDLNMPETHQWGALDWFGNVIADLRVHQKYLSRLFSDEQMLLIEVAYEGLNNAGFMDQNQEAGSEITGNILAAHHFHEKRATYSAIHVHEYLCDGEYIDVNVGYTISRMEKGHTIIKDIMKNIIRNKGEFKP